MFYVFGIMILGIVAGFGLRRIPDIKIINKLIMAFIYLLLLFLGLAVGANQAILDNMSTIGWQALVLTFGALLGSVLMAWGIYKRFFKSDEQKKSSSELNDKN